jgi:hypothetical protein
MAGAIHESVVSADESRDVRGREDAEIAGVERDLSSRFDGQLGWRAHDDRHLVPGGQRLSKHVPAERPCCAKNDQASHQKLMNAA